MPVTGHVAVRERHAEAAGTDAQFQCRTARGQVGQDADALLRGSDGPAIVETIVDRSQPIVLMGHRHP